MRALFQCRRVIFDTALREMIDGSDPTSDLGCSKMYAIRFPIGRFDSRSDDKIGRNAKYDRTSDCSTVKYTRSDVGSELFFKSHFAKRCIPRAILHQALVNPQPTSTAIHPDHHVSENRPLATVASAALRRPRPHLDRPALQQLSNNPFKPIPPSCKTIPAAFPTNEASHPETQPVIIGQ
jgi:hypothetical protein